MKEKIKRFVQFIEYGSDALKAISKGVTTVVTGWPDWPAGNGGSAVAKEQQSTGGNNAGNA